MRVIKKYSDLPDAVSVKLESLIDNEFDHIPIVAKTVWAKPDFQ